METMFFVCFVLFSLTSAFTLKSGKVLCDTFSVLPGTVPVKVSYDSWV